MRAASLAFFAGVLICHSQRELAGQFSIFLLIGVFAITVWIPSLRLSAWLIAGFLWANGWAYSSPQLPLLYSPATSATSDLQLEGWIASIPENSQTSTRFLFVTDSLPHKNIKLRLSWYGSVPELNVGDYWRLTVRLKRPHGLRNPGGFDYERWLFARGITATGYVRQSPAPQRLGERQRYPVNRLRQNIANHLNKALSEQRQGAILIALAVGDRQNIQPWQWDVFTRTGTGHLMAISGLHIGMVAGLAFFLMRRLWVLFPALVNRWPAPKAAALAALFSAAAYALLAGLSLPTQRAFIMLAVALFALIWQRSLLPSSALCLALLMVLLLDPGAPLAAGFWLSFGAVATILYALVARHGAYRPLRRWLSLQVFILLALLPAGLIFFQSASLLAPVANLIAIPWVSVSVVPLTLAAVAAGLFSQTLEAFLLAGAALTMEWLWGFLAWLADAQWLQWLQLRHAKPPLWTIIFALPGLLLLLAPRGLPARWLGFLLCLPLFFARPVPPAAGDVYFTLLDAGEGLATVVETRRHVLVYDTGPRIGRTNNAARIALLPFLRERGIERIDTLIVSHADSNHSGGARTLLENIAVDQVLTGSVTEVPIANALPCSGRQAWSWDSVDFRMLHPPADKSAAWSGNNSSCVLQISAHGKRILISGDIETAAVRRLQKTYPDKLHADILVPPHHGTRRKTEPALLNAVNARFILLATGYQNRYGHPYPETLQRYRETGAQVLNTARNGAISFHIQKDTPLQANNYRQDSQRYWHTK